MICNLIQFCMAAFPFVLISVTLYFGWKWLWKLFDDMFVEVQ